MKCENQKCNNEHNGEFGSGKFCSRSCANSRSFDSNSRLLKSKANQLYFRKNGYWGFQTKKGESQPQEQTEKCIRTWNSKILDSDWESLSYERKRKRVILEQSGECYDCKLSEWKGCKLTLELEHINGNHLDNSRENLKAICPNCHSITPTWRGKNKPNQIRYSEEEWYNSYKSSKNIRQSLLDMDLAAKGANYKKMKRIIEKFTASTI